ncbi:TonB-dependent receptor [Novosphingobium panipatense]|uniref:Outer membrane receptor for ferrienterochelin and colicins n=1 Tax=Novosphingobium panipatense TaxID=428991 RepID=A0ABY1QTA6_9SPHN|nr:TonB-dependent receptor [Novosphingobium panipatense]SMP79594.1 Outer membrane receptor for ferrienterochelin and colicins [Novosphingobium panipatense]
MRVTQRAIQAMGDEMRVVRNGFFVGVCACALISATPAMAQADQVRNFDLPAQSLTEALRAVARQSGLEFSAPADPLRGKTSKPLKGQFSPAQAAKRLLKGTRLTAEVIDGALIVRVGGMSADANMSGNGDEIIVTGSHIKSAETASPTIRLDADSIKLAGQTDLGEAIRSVSQNFGGGQNPGVGWGASGVTNQNMDSSSTANLRGLGGDATLTLLNGHRLSYGSFVQAVDLGAIPLAAVDRMEIVADGASAIYGSDAVGGVVNIILKQDYDGASLAATLGGATDGGDFLQQYSAAVGKRWTSGSLTATYERKTNSAIYAGDRAYSSQMPGESTLYPQTHQDSVVASLRQVLGASVEMHIDGSYSRRTSFINQLTDYGLKYEQRPDVTSYSITPSLRVGMVSDWNLNISATYGESNSKYDEREFDNDELTYNAVGSYFNRLVTAEGYLSGSLKGLAARPIELVLGGGYRYNMYEEESKNVLLRRGSVKSYYGFGEAALPLIEPEDHLSWAYKLKVSAAVRYEYYPGTASVAVPKLGLIYAPSSDFDIKASWGRSFKVPILSQQFAPHVTYQYPATWVGASGYPTGSTVLIDYGGNVDLKPERAGNWSATLDIHPSWLKNFRASVSYFEVAYKDRIVQPVSGAALFSALSNPIYAAFVSYDPTAEQVQQLIASSSKYYDYSGGSGTSQTIAILYDRYVNAARQNIHGVDLSAEYRFDLRDASSLTINGNASLLWSRQVINADMGELQLAGTIFNPPRLRARGSIIWSDRKWTLGTYLNHIAGLEDNRSSPSVKIHPMTTLDLSARLTFPKERTVLGGLALQISAQNVFNQRPPYAAPSGAYSYYVNYDSTNFSPIGRFISFTISKDW